MERRDACVVCQGGATVTQCAGARTRTRTRAQTCTCARAPTRTRARTAKNTKDAAPPTSGAGAASSCIRSKCRPLLERVAVGRGQLADAGHCSLSAKPPSTKPSLLVRGLADGADVLRAWDGVGLWGPTGAPPPLLLLLLPASYAWGRTPAAGALCRLHALLKLRQRLPGAGSGGCCWCCC